VATILVLRHNELMVESNCVNILHIIEHLFGVE
jgi:hypothetical protein